VRASCDPYQRLWCNADFQINKLFPKGKYSTEIPNARQCLKPGGTGAIRLYKEDGVIPTDTPSPTVVVKNEVTAMPVKEVVTQTTPCSCSSKTIIITATITSLVSSALFSLLLKRK